LKSLVIAGVSALALSAVVAAPVSAKTFKFAFQGDAQSLDPHSLRQRLRYMSVALCIDYLTLIWCWLPDCLNHVWINIDQCLSEVTYCHPCVL